jgi:predicted transcriptional regulator
MGKVLELSDETYQQLVDLAQQQQRMPEEMLRVCLATYEAARYERVHQQMIAEGLLAALPTRPLPFGGRFLANPERDRVFSLLS